MAELIKKLKINQHEEELDGEFIDSWTVKNPHLMEPINNDPVKDRLDKYLEKNRIILQGDYIDIIEIETDPEDEWVEIFPGEWELVPKKEIQNIFNKKEPSEDDLGRPTNRP